MNIHSNKSRYKFYQLLLNEDIMTTMLSERNRYGAECKTKETVRRARTHVWRDMDNVEIKRFFGILFWMFFFFANY